MFFTTLFYCIKKILRLIGIFEITFSEIASCLIFSIIFKFIVADYYGPVSTYKRYMNCSEKIKKRKLKAKRKRKIQKEAQLNLLNHYINLHDSKEKINESRDEVVNNNLKQGNETTQLANQNNNTEDEDIVNAINEVNQQLNDNSNTDQQELSEQLLYSLIKLNTDNIKKTYNSTYKKLNVSKSVQKEIIEKLLIEKKEKVLHHIRLRLMVKFINRYGALDNSNSYYAFYKGNYILSKARIYLTRTERNQ